ncbi:gliding motility-associated-like protein [Flavobacterium sp. 90]|uniref:T9SS type B sorting domain-containing protein n=1 Tax=unclassified Flavobacterium TaxID=196869 RepID=UPI000EB00457|nr:MULTISPECIES: T9SS type B sorting domain-containing protein [unclassified Flavobacterium]RKR10332.1 gliding motility-associated-like protein [Flavobacterium sp. 81]TCK54117.1 gliding motility-associated-like protein [Flavobacterium sp. 90]
MQNITYKKPLFFCFSIFLFLVTFQARAQFPFFESFKKTTTSNIQFGGSPAAFLTAGAGSKDGFIDSDGDGYLRLTSNRSNQQGMIWSDLYAFPSFYGMTISFEYYTHGGNGSNGADGICFILFDATTPRVTPGAYGGSLGYAQQNSAMNGFSGGYLGVGIDEYGNFAAKSEGKSGGTPQITSNSIVLRGQGSGITGYPYLTSAQTIASPYLFNIPGKDRTATDNSKDGFRKLEIILKPRKGGGFFIDVNLTHGNTKTLVINNFEYTTPAPENLKFAISSSTGGDNNFHEIRNLNLSVDLSTLLSPIARPISLSACAGLTCISSNDININNEGNVNVLGTTNRESVDLDEDIPGIQTSKTVAGKGTFTYNSTGGAVTFTPLFNSVEEPITINYTFNDSYGKTSNVSTITYTPIINKPANVVSQKTICPGETYTWPVNGKPYSSSGIYTSVNNGCVANEVLELTVNQKTTEIIATGIIICKGGTGSLRTKTDNQPSLSFNGTWNPLTDPKTFMPERRTNKIPKCGFYDDQAASYQTITFSVNVTGEYTLKMTGITTDYRAGYIYKGNYTLGTCPEDGTWITGDDDYGIMGEKIPTLTAHLEVGTLYTLVSLLQAYESLKPVDYTWTLRPPDGGGFFLNPITAWYTSSIGGSPIGWGDTFNPVGVPNSGLSNTNTAGQTTYYIGDITECFKRIPVVFEIKEDATVEAATSTTETCIDIAIPAITHTTYGITGIDSSTNLPTGVTATFTNNRITISGTPTVTGIFNYTINLTKDSNYCGTSAATGNIIVNALLTTPLVTTTNANCSTPSTSKIDNYLDSNTYIFAPLGPTVDNTGVITAMKVNTEYTVTSTNTTCTSAKSAKFHYTQQLTKPTASITYSASSYSTSEETKVVTLNGQVDGKYTATPLGLYIDENTGAIDPNKSLANSYTVTYTFTNGDCSNTTQTNVQIVSPKIAAWLVVKDANDNGTIEPGENITFMLRMSNIDPDHVTLHNITGSIDLPAHTTLVSQTQSMYVTPSRFSFSTPQYTDYPYLWDLTYQREPTILITVKADCDLTNVSQIETKGRIYVDGVEIQTSIPPSPLSALGSWIAKSGNNQYLVPPLLANCVNFKDCPTALPVSTIKISVLKIDNPEAICSGNTVNLSSTVNTESTPGILTYWTDAVATIPLTNSTAVAVSGTYYIKNTSAQGCETIKPVVVRVNPKPETIITKENICFGESFPWSVDGKTYTASGTYTKTNDGCTSDQVLNLTIKEKLIVTQLAFSTCIGDGEEFNNKTVCEVTSGIVTGIGTPMRLPSGLSLIWSASDNTIKLNGSATESGDFWFSVPLLTENCEKREATGNIVVRPKAKTITTTENICFGKSFFWDANGKIYTTSGTYTKNYNGCIADEILKLTVDNKPETVTTTKEICFGESFPWSVDGKTYSASGTYTKTNDGCTADQTLELTIGTKPETIITKENICFAESFPWTVDGKTYSASGTYTKTNDGCTADQTLELTIGTKPETIITKENICFAESFPWTVDGKTYSASGIYTKTNDGCTADQTLELTIGTKPKTIITKENICFGESFPWSVDGKTYSVSGIYTKTNDGCTADQTLELTIGTKPETIITKENICFGESFPWSVDGEIYSVSGIYTKTNDGCTADQTLELTIGTKPETIITKENICFGESFPWSVDGETYSASGTYTKTNDGCTADQTLELTIGTKPETIITKENICFGESFPWSVDGKTYTASGTYTQINDGCTADQTLELTIGTKPETIITKENICFGESFPWTVDGEIYSVSGIYTKTNDGCTADQTLELTIGTKPEAIITKENICFGESFPWSVDGETYNVSGIYTKTNNGCTADQTLELTIGIKPETIITKENICFGESFPWSVDGKTYSVSGIYTKTNDGCTADQTLELTIGIKPETIITKENICFGESFPWSVNGKTYSVSGTYTKTNDGCTADQTLELTIGTKPETIITKENICFGESFPWSVNGKTYSVSGTYTKTNDGCTADQTLELTIGTKPETIITKENICFGESFPWSVNGKTYSVSGTYTKTNDGCTADQTLELTIGTKPEAIITKENICFGESFPWAVNGETYNVSGTYTKNNNGCTPDQTLELTIGTKPETIITKENICFGESFSWSVDGETYSASGTYTKTNDGCTADQSLELTIRTKPETIITKENICFGESFPWSVDGETYSASGIYTKINDGCSADQTLELTIGTKPETIITKENICFGESFPWSVDGKTYSASGIYTKTNDGCTADQTLELTIGTKPETIITKENICFGESFPWSVDGKTYSASGTYTKTNDGCTADQTLELTMAKLLEASLITNSLIPELCSGDKDGSFSIEITGGIMPYSLTLDDKKGSYNQIIGDKNTFTNLEGGSHIIYIKDSSDCTTALIVEMPKAIVINPVANVTYSCLDNITVNSVTIDVDPSITDVNDLDYSLDGIIYQSNNLFTNVSPGMQTIYARNSNGCIQQTKEFFIDYVEPLNLTLADGELNEIVATATGGESQYRYSFNNEPNSTTNKFIIYKSGDYSITVTDKNGCTVTTSRYFEFIDVCIPNHFTPNGDGINDEWGPGCTTQYKNLTFMIFDRYGRIIGNYKYGQKWDGKYNGTELSSGDYWYVFKLNDNKDNREFVGHFTLYR